jgi:hypothetical protein
MNELAPYAYTGEVITPQDVVNVVGWVHPLKAKRVFFRAQAGSTVKELLSRALEGHRLSRLTPYMRVEINGEVVPQRMWKHVRPKAGTLLTFRPIPAKEHAGAIISIAILVAAIVIAPYAAPLIAGFLGISAAVASSLFIAGVTLAGSLVTNAMFPPGKSQLAEARSASVGGPAAAISHSIAGARNSAAPWEPIPVVLGRHRMAPLYAAPPFTEVVGDDQYLRLLFVWGYGPLALSDYRIGNTPLTSFQDVQIEERYGLDGDAAITLYPTNSPFEEAVGAELLAVDDWNIRFTALETDEISIDVMAPEGVYSLNTTTGSFDPYVVIVQARYRNVLAGGYINLPDLTFTRSISTIRLGIRQAVPRGQYEVSVRKATTDNDSSNVHQAVFWTTLRSFKNEPPVTFSKPLAMTAIRIKATGQLNNTVDTFNGIVHSRVTAYNGSFWNVQTLSQNPADLFRWVLQGPANARPRPDEELDLANLEEWWTYCNTKGFRFNQIRTMRSSVFEALFDIAAAGRGTPTYRDGKWAVSWDDPDSPVVQLFTPRNSWGLNSSRAYRHLPHAWRIRFINELKDWAEDERIVYDDGYTASNATLYESIELTGVTHPDLIWRHGRFQIAQARLRPERHTLNCDWEHIACTRGDRVRVQHDVLLIGLVSGRVLEVDDPTVVVDEVVTMVEGTNYSIRFRLNDGSYVVRRVATTPGEHTTLTLAETGDLPEVGNLFAFGVSDTETSVYRVFSIDHQDNMYATISLVDDAQAISYADEGSIPEFDSNITIPPDSLTLPPQDLQLREFLYREEGVFRAGAELTWQVPRLSRTIRFDVEIKDETALGDWRSAGTVIAPATSFITRDLNRGSYAFRVRAVFDDGTLSSWASVSGIILQQLGSPPEDVENFRISVIGDSAILTWNPVGTINLDHYEIRFSTDMVTPTWNSSTLLVEIVSSESTLVPAMEGAYLIKAVTQQNVYSENPAIIISNVAGLAGRNVVEIMTESITFPGDKDNTQVVDDRLQLGDAQVLSDWGLLNGIVSMSLGSGDDLFVLGDGYYFFDDGLDLGEVFTSRVSVEMTATGISLTFDIFTLEDWFGPQDFFGDVLPTDWAAEVEVRTTNDDPGGSPTWSAWAPVIVGDYTARAYEFRAHLQSFRADVTPAIIYLAVTVDMPDRIIPGRDITVPAIGMRIDFDPPYKVLRSFLYAAQDLSTGNYVEVTNQDETGVDIRVFNASAVGIVKTLDYNAIGYGRVT